MKQRGTLLAALALMTALVAGCGDADDGTAGGRPSPQPSAPSAPSSPATATTIATLTPTNAPAGTAVPTPEWPAGEILVSYQRTGGIGGFNDRLIILRDGRVTRITRTERCDFRLNPKQLGELQADLRQADFAAVRVPAGPPTVADGFTYLVNHQGRALRTHDGAIPAQLQPAMGRLGKLAGQPCLR